MEWRFIGGDARDFLYPVAFTVQPGDFIVAEENPDPQWFEPVAADPDEKKE